MIDSSLLKTWWNSQSQPNRDFIQGVTTGTAIGIIVPTVVYSIENINTQVQNDNRKNFWKSFQLKPLKRLKATVVSGVIRNTMLFGTIPLFERMISPYFPNKETSSLLGSICSSVLLSYTLFPLQGIKDQLYTKDKNITLEKLKIALKRQYTQPLITESSAFALQSSFYWPIYLYVSSHTNTFLKNKKISPWLSPLISGYLGAFAANIFTYPIEKAVQQQKINNSSFSIWKTLFKMSKEEGIPVLFKGVFKSHFTRVLIPGMLTEVIYDKINQLFKELK